VSEDGAPVPAPPRRQLNIGLTPEQYGLVELAAAEFGQTVTEYCRGAIMGATRADVLNAARREYLDGPAPEPPSWWNHLVAFFSRRS